MGNASSVTSWRGISSACAWASLSSLPIQKVPPGMTIVSAPSVLVGASDTPGELVMPGTTGKAGTPVGVAPLALGNLHARNARMSIREAPNRANVLFCMRPPRRERACRIEAEDRSWIHYAPMKPTRNGQACGVGAGMCQPQPPFI